VLVYRNGVEIGRAKVHVRERGAPLGTHAYVLLDEDARRPEHAAGGTPPRWVAVSVPGHEAEKGLALDPAVVGRLVMPPEFVTQVRSVLVPGAAMLITDGAVLEHTTGVAMTIVTGDPQATVPKTSADPG
jgi:hypothetical protein